MNRRNFLGSVVAGALAVLVRRAPKPAPAVKPTPLDVMWADAKDCDPLEDIRAAKRLLDQRNVPYRTGNRSGEWIDARNWSEGIRPQPGDIVVFAEGFHP